MFFLAFLVFGGIVWALGLAFVRAARHQVGTYSVLALLFVLTGMILFTFLSWWAGIIPMEFGNGALVKYSVSFQESYLGRGALGIAIIFLGLGGIVSPALAAILISRRPALRAPKSAS